VTEVWERYAPWYITEESLVFSPDRRELGFYRKLRTGYGGPCLEIGAGHGRLASSLCTESVTAALEPSRRMLDGWKQEDTLLAERVRGTGRELPFRDSAFDFVTFPYNGIQCVLDRDERRQILRESCRVLRTGGRFVVEVCHAFSFRPEETGAQRYSHRLGDGRTVRLVESIRRDVDSRTITYDMIYTDTEGNSENVVLVLALVERDELLEDIGLAGFTDPLCLGDYNGDQFMGENSPRLLMLAGKGED
jgi:ubiquinone/menaquinone biosynthesis C-methylase UbiE